MVSGLRGLREAEAAGAGSGSRGGRALRPLPDERAAATTGTCSTSYERQIVCVCESCWALRSGDPEFRPTGSRTLWLEDFELPEEIWAQFRIPIGLAFFMHSSVTDCVVALYPSPAGATESELHFETWSRLAA